MTATERAIAELVATGAANTAIARRLHCSPRTVRNTISIVYRVLRLPEDCNRRVMLARLVLGHQDRHSEE